MYLREDVVYGGTYTRETLLLSHICFKYLTITRSRLQNLEYLCTTLFPVAFCYIPRLHLTWS